MTCAAPSKPAHSPAAAGEAAPGEVSSPSAPSASNPSPPAPAPVSSPAPRAQCLCCTDRAFHQPVLILRGPGAPRVRPLEGVAFCTAHACQYDAALHRGALDSIWDALAAQATQDGAAAPVKELTEVLFRWLP